MEESEISDGAKKRFAEIKPENYDMEYRRLGRRILSTKFIYALLVLMGFTVPFLMVYMVQISPLFTMGWAGLMGYSLVTAFRRTEWLVETHEVRQLVLGSILDRDLVSLRSLRKIADE